MSRDHSDIEPWRRLRDLEPPIDSKQRVLQQVEEELFPTKPGRGLRSLAFAVSTAAAVAALVWWSGIRRSPESVAEVEITEGIGPMPSERPTNDATKDDHHAFNERFHNDNSTVIGIAEGDKQLFSRPDATITVSGPATVKIEGSSVLLNDGQVVIAGSADVRTPRCRAQIEGNAKVSVNGEKTSVMIRSGNAKVTSGCHVKYVELTVLDPKERGETTSIDEQAAVNPPLNEAAQERREPNKSRKERDHPTSKRASTLRQQVDGFRRARKLSKTNEVAALRAFDSFIARWPKSPLVPEVKAERKRLVKRLNERKSEPEQ